MRASLLSIILLVISTLAYGQNGAIAGKVTDKKTGEGVIGATVLVTGTVQAAPVQLDGGYRLELPAGTYNLSVTYIGYKTLTFAGIVVVAGKDTPLSAQMEESTTSLNEVTVTGVKQTGSEVALLQDLKKSEVVVSGISSDQIVKSLDRDAAEVVKRVPGVTIQANNFIVVRGLAERYNTVLLNDALTPSAEVDTRSFSFDILPSSVIDRVLVFKSPAPELPGEFGGGVVKVYTKNSVLENTTSLTVSSWDRAGTTFNGGYQQSARSGTDWLGFDNGLRKAPGVIGTGAFSSASALSRDQLQQGAVGLRNEWVPSLHTAMPDLRVSLGITRKFELGRVYLSNVSSVSYANTREQYGVQRQRLETGSGSFIYNYLDERSLSTSRLGIIHNWEARLSDHSRLDFRNFLNQYGTDEIVHRTGIDYAQGGNGRERDNYALHYQSRTIYSGQLGGNHDVGATRSTTLTWATGYNYVFRNEPDYRRFRTGRDVPGPGEDLQPFRVEVSQVGSQQDNSSYFSRLKENTYMASGQLEKRLSGRDSTRANQYKLRAGFYTERKGRSYNSRFFSYVPSTSDDFRQDLLTLPIEQIFQPQNLDPKTGFQLKEGTSDNDSYTANNTLVAGYLSAVAPVSDKFNVSGGVRLEYNRKYLQSGDATIAAYDEKRTFVLPSVNATYNFSEKHLLRLAGGLTVNRPEFREIAQYSYYDFSNNAVIIGNRDLRTAKIYNTDLRYEFYPSRSEVLSVGVFYKHFTDAIEQVTNSTTGSTLELSYRNADRAYDVGVEVEARKGFEGLTDNPFLQHFSVVLNASLIKSQVTLVDTAASSYANNRPLQGQSPYVVNAGLFYQDADRRWQFSAQYNVIGQRILFASTNSQNYTIFELPRHVIDLALTKGFGPHVDLRVGIQDLLNQYTRLNYDSDRNNTITSDDKGVFGRYRRGQYSTVGVTYKF